MKNKKRWNFHPVFETKFENWLDIEQAISTITDTTEKGTAFEQFCYFYFLYHRELFQIKEVWNNRVRGREIPKEIIQKYKLEVNDYGVDGVNLLTTGEIEAWQAKFHSDRSSATSRQLSTFWAEAEYANFRRIISNANSLPIVSFKKLRHRQTLVDKFLSLDDQFFDELYKFAGETDSSAEFVMPKFVPRPHQQKMISDVSTGLKQFDRGKLIAACGTGKTLVSLWITEDPSLNFSRVLFLAPSIALVAQTLKGWALHKTQDFSYLVVCSDKSIQAEQNEADDNFQYDPVDLEVSVTTTAEEVILWLTQTSGKRQYIFATYHSADVIETALKDFKYKFDLIIFDEAHRTVGLSTQKFGLALEDFRIPARKRLFMTATERLVSPRIQSLASQSGKEILSMGDVNIYGPTLHQYNFGMAITEGVIADYQIVLAEISNNDLVNDVIRRRIVNVDAPIDDNNLAINAELLFQSAFIYKAFKENTAKKIISFHNNRKRAISFSNALSVLINAHNNSDEKPIVDFILGNQNVSERAQKIAEFELAPTALLSNVKCLAEGVDIPLIDSVYFVDPKSSMIEIVQAIGRALRKPYKSSEQKTANIIVPVLIPENTERLEDIKWDDVLLTFHTVIQAMRDQDQRLAEEVDMINLYEVTGRRQGRRISERQGRIVFRTVPGISIGKNINFEDFISHINMRIAVANANPESSNVGYSFLGKGERRSEYKPIIQLFGDYNPDKYMLLVEPTIDKYTNHFDVLNSSQLLINHNNISHTVRLGVIEEINKNEYRLTNIGRMYKDKIIDFNDMFRNQMFLYSAEKLFTYRIMLEILTSVGYMNHIEFLCGPYIIQNTRSIEDEIKMAEERILKVRGLFPNIDLISIGNRDDARMKLNEICQIDIPDHDVWSDRSTVKNKFRYIKNALMLWDFIEKDSGGFRTPITLIASKNTTAMDILSKSNPINAPFPDAYGTWYWLDADK